MGRYCYHGVNVDSDFDLGFRETAQPGEGRFLKITREQGPAPPLGEPLYQSREINLADGRPLLSVHRRQERISADFPAVGAFFLARMK